MLGVSGRRMLHALADGEVDVERLVALARASFKGKAPELRRALTSRLTLAQRFVLCELLQRLAELEAATATDYHEPGGDYFDRQHRQTRQQRLIMKLEALGLKITVEALPKAA